MELFFPRYAAPGRSGIIPPSPPAEQRAKRLFDLNRTLRSFTGRMPTKEDMARLMARIGTPGSMTGGMSSLSGVETQLFGANSPAITAPTAFWRLENVNDSGPNNLNLTNNGTVTFVPGKIGNGAAFNDTSYLSHVDDALFRAGTGVAISICGWCYAASTPSKPASFSIIVGCQGSSVVYALYLETPNNPYIVNWRGFDSSSTVSNVQVTTSGTYDVWHFVVVTFDPALSPGNNQGVSWDGAAQTFPTPGSRITAIRSLSATFGVGAYGSGADKENQWFLDALGWWQGYALTGSECTALFNAGAGREYYSGAWH